MVVQQMNLLHVSSHQNYICTVRCMREFWMTDLNLQVFWDVMPCQMVVTDVSEKLRSDTLVNIYQSTQRNLQ
jgi:hypothetical protein